MAKELSEFSSSELKELASQLKALVLAKQTEQASSPTEPSSESEGPLTAAIRNHPEVSPEELADALRL